MTNEPRSVQTLESLASEIRACKACLLWQGANIGVAGIGPVNASIALVGEAPGAVEDRNGLPFQGSSGQFLDSLLASINLDRKSIFITNIVKHRPPGNRDPSRTEIITCGEFLERQLEIIKPKVVVTLGRFSMNYFMPDVAAISKIHGQPRQVNGQWIIPMYHPAAALHQPTLKRVIEDDWKMLPRLLDTIVQAPEQVRDEPVDARFF